MTIFQDAFISYGRADSKAFATQLNQRLIAEGLTVWFDFKDIPLGVDYPKQIDEGIKKAHNFLFIISPHSVNSPYCRLEIEIALKWNKRIIPLLHVEEISRETWRQRNPTGAEADWQAYTAAGEHSSFANMHPVISKINWVYFRHGLDDYEQAMQGLLAIFERQKDYVNLHTRLLAQALEWERQHKRSRYLLVAEERQQAEDWLLTRFTDEQPPCIPTDLHCELITESLKNARNLMTQVFLAYAEEDKAISEQVRRSLMRTGLTVWTNTTDIQIGAEFQAAIYQGIEAADNLVYLLSPASLRSSYCQQELDYALSLNKRVIPVLVKPMDETPIPDTLKTLQYIDLTDNVADADYQKDESDLLRILRQDADYYDNHKQLLVKALKWKQQDRNTSILLRGYNLRHGEKWLQLGKQRLQHRPTALHEGFIEESLRQPPAASLDVFISYSRADADFARKLNDALQLQGKTTWFDQESIAAGTADFQQEIYRGIEVSDNFLFILSPNSIQSEYCADEVNYATGLNRRIVTVLCRPISTADLHPALAKVQWLDFSQQDESFSHQFNRLVRVLETNREHVHSHTKWSQRALEWEHKNRSEDLLLRGNELAIAQEWLKQALQQRQLPAVTDLQKALIEFSQASVDAAIQREKRQEMILRFLLVGVSAALVVAVGALALAFRQSQQATKSQIQALNQASQASFTLNPNSFQALLQALEAGTRLKQTFWLQQDAALRAEVMTVLGQASYWVRELNRLEGHSHYIQDISFSPDGNIIATASLDDTAKLWSRDGSLLRTLTGHSDAVKSVSFSPNSNMLATASNDQTIKLWTLDGQEIITLNGHGDWVNSVSFSPDGQTIATASFDRTVKLWTQTGEELAVLAGHENGVNSVSFSPDGQTIATASHDTTVKLWSIEGQLLHTFKGHQDEVYDVSFSPDGQTLATASKDHTVILWNSATRTKQLSLKGHQDTVFSVRFSPDGQMIATTSEDETVKFWTREGREIITLHGHHSRVDSVWFSPDGHTLASAGFDKTIRLWRLNLPNLIPIYNAHNATIYGVDFSPDGQMIATASHDNTVNLWTRDGRLSQTLTGHQGPVISVSFSPDGQSIATASADQTVKLWDWNGQGKNTLSDHQAAISSVSFSPDGQIIGTASWDQTAKLWGRDGHLIRTLEGHKDGILSISFSPDGQSIATASQDKTAKIWTIDGKELNTLTGHNGAVYWVRFSPDGDLIVTASEDNTAKLWTIDGQEILSLKSHSAGVLGLSFSPDGQRIATASDDNTVKLWQRDGTLITTLIGHQGPVNGLSFSPDGAMLASVGADQQVLIWNIQDFTLDGLLAYGCGWVGDYLKTNAAAPRHLCNSVNR